MPARLALTDAAATPRVGASPAPSPPPSATSTSHPRADASRDADARRDAARRRRRVRRVTRLASDLGRPVDGSRLDESLTLRASSHHPRARSRRGDRARRRIETRDLDVVSQSKRAVGLR
jgi:hypothetical protein